MSFDQSPARTLNCQNAASGIFDLCVLGGGIVGASIARDAAIRGYRVLLLEAHDYAHGTSSRSSKLLHGGVRYLEQGDVSLVAEALAERAIFLASAPHIVRAQRFLYPIVPKLTRPEWQVKIGLMAYDYLARMLTVGSPRKFTEPFRGHAEVEILSAEVKQLRALGLHFSSVLGYVDGQMDDSRLVIENIIDAEMLGATAINYVEPVNIERLRGGRGFPPPGRRSVHPMWQVLSRCKISGTEIRSQARYLVNATGAGVRKTHELIDEWNPNWPQPVYSRGTHLLFAKDLGLPGLILPTAEPGRYYFVIPFFSSFGAGTLVGTTDRAVAEYEANPQPNDSEIAELLGFLQRDLPAAGLDRNSMYHAFCGMRVLAAKPSQSVGSVSQLSRREEYLFDDGYLAVLGGKYTTSRHTAEQALDAIDRYFGVRKEPKQSTRKRALPGGDGWSEEFASELRMKLADEIFHSPSAQELIRLKALDQSKLSDIARERARTAVHRFGVRAANLLGAKDHMFEPSAPFLRSELEFVRANEQAVSVEDALSRRLGIRYQPHSRDDFQRWLTLL